MDAERDKLVAALRRKLTELDAQVVAFRRDRAEDFRRYATDLLRSVTDAVAADVALVIDGPSSCTAAAYPALYPGFLDADRAISTLTPACTSHAHVLPQRAASSSSSPSPPPPPLDPALDVLKEGSQRPPLSPLFHARDDFHGVFTPHFLPLLDSSSRDRWPRNTDAADTVPPAAGATEAAAAAAAAGAIGNGSRFDTNSSVAVVAVAADAADAAKTAAAAVVSAAAPPPTPEPKLKSALRRAPSVSSSRSSMSAPPNPPAPPARVRRVRFSLDGAEFHPSESPPEEEHEHIVSWLMQDDHRAFDASVDPFSQAYQGVNSPPTMPSELLADPFTAAAEEASASAPLAPEDAPSPPLSPSSPNAAGFYDSLDPLDSLLRPSHGPAARGWGDGDQHRIAAQMDSESQSPAQGNGTPPPFVPAAPAPPPPPSGAAQHRLPSSVSPLTPRRRHSLILDDDNEGSNVVPFSRKVSSSDRLRALSKLPLEDPSMWTVVNPQDDTIDADGRPPPTVHEIVSTHRQTAFAYPHLAPQLEPLLEDEHVIYQNGDNEKRASENDSVSASDSDSSDEDDFIAMRSSRKNSAASVTSAAPAVPAVPMTNTDTAPAVMPSTQASAALTPTNETASVARTSNGQVVRSSAVSRQALSDKPNGQSSAAGDDSDFFDFEMDGETPHHAPSRLRAADREDDADALSDDFGQDGRDEPDQPAAAGVDVDGRDASRPVFNHRKLLGAALGGVAASNNDGESNSNGNSNGISNGNGISIGANNGRDSPADASSASSPAPQMPSSVSVGSYRGRPIDLFQIVKDPRVLQEAAQLGELNSFVGSIHDAHQPATIAEFSSLSGSDKLNLLSGTPRSLTERMAMDDARHYFSPKSRGRESDG